VAGHIDSVAQRVGADQRSARIVAEDVDQGAGVDRVDMLGVERQPARARRSAMRVWTARSRRIAVNSPNPALPLATISRA
jgi:hypothetical protein